ncbi:hypothetical protein KFL_000090210 [Klebsormidium nitens]|uniref:Transmembrane protein n=1 Tax=Klebsormidium nitens TaxID=105231 RepID=A0A1Y1HNP1_KLENI|nr:hypothetical protein KFL_000090210 [Klebsormidium nitens]|eukprot:GAQ78177.1 hypothetical protein KFL_000090210 [Klebsormidium nitens]
MAPGSNMAPGNSEETTAVALLIDDSEQPQTQIRKEFDPKGSAGSALREFCEHLVLQVWPNICWWIVVIAAIPFSAGALVYVFAREPAIREMSIDKADGLPDPSTYAQTVLDHIRYWQVHATCAIVYCLTGPVQFIDGMRLKRLPMHRASGYAFLASGCVLSVTGMLMAPYSQFDKSFEIAMFFLGPAWLFSAGSAVWSVRRKRIQLHREWMIRTAAVGFSVIFVRPMVPLLSGLFGLTFKQAGAPATWICLLLSLAGTQLYISMRYRGVGGLCLAVEVGVCEARAPRSFQRIEPKEEEVPQCPSAV